MIASSILMSRQLMDFNHKTMLLSVEAFWNDNHHSVLELSDPFRMTALFKFHVDPVGASADSVIN
jgi:hypothetical protein